MAKENQLTVIAAELLPEIRQLIDESRQRAAIAVNAELTLLYWDIGNHIQQHLLSDERAEYGKQVVRNLAARLTAEFGRGWSEKQLRHCLHTVETFTFPDRGIVYTLRRQLNGSQIRILMYLDDR